MELKSFKKTNIEEDVTSQEAREAFFFFLLIYHTIPLSSLTSCHRTDLQIKRKTKKTSITTDTLYMQVVGANLASTINGAFRRAEIAGTTRVVATRNLQLSVNYDNKKKKEK